LLHQRKIVVVMPAYRAEKTLAGCYAAIPHDIVDEVLLVDDASDDATVAVAGRLGIAVSRHAENRGYGASQKTCYADALARGADIVIMLHPDYQYEPRLITAMAAMVASDVYDVVIGSLFAWTLGLGVLFLAIFTTKHSAGNGTAGVRVLFGSIFGLSSTQARTVAIVATAACILLLAVARPLLYTSLDPAVAAARGIPVRALELGFLALLGLVAAQASQAVGALLLLGLLAAPAGAAHLLTTTPYRGLALSAALAVGSVWLGLTLSYVFPTLPPSTMVIAAAVGTYVAALLATGLRRLKTGGGHSPISQSRSGDETPSMDGKRPQGALP
jgi:zinc/manganese transport system permease protein